ncbi:diacylglycerol/lipid kinase family protein [Croceicoccus sediminis]|uniref:diacylglycerol/lipid kinase family protein n=1 Tax=Croceicoccus sediminis TaxID=2571150 RepID=UPI001182F4D2|nr:diacylglycerol kinase family protein [Croceicoccus sediminis]
MNHARKTWLVINPDSGSYDDAAFEALQHCCGKNGIDVDKVIRFPEDDLPTASELDAAGIEFVTIYTGDGTINALVTGLYGWGGAVLVLPGGTMNLLSIRLHGDVEPDVIVSRFCANSAQRQRPHVIRCKDGDALAGMMAGPACVWSEVREAMRHFDVVGMAGSAADAVRESTDGPMVRITRPEIGREDGYPLVLMSPEDGKMTVDAYRAETLGEYAQQGIALLKRDFREGPHDELGELDEMTITACEGERLDVLVDGEPGDLDSEATFRVVPCEVDLVVTRG